MKKAKLLGAIALMFALVLGAASCAQDSTPSGTEPSGSESSGSDLNGATDNDDTNSGGTQNSTPSGSNPSGHKPSVTKPEGTDIKDVIDSIDFNGTWKLTDAYCRKFIFYSEGDTVLEYETPEDVVNAIVFSGFEFDENLCTEFSNDSLKTLVEEFEEPHDIFIDWCLKVNDDNDEIYLYHYVSSLYNNGEVEMGEEIKLTFTKQ